jgi:hypothetical protein
VAVQEANIDARPMPCYRESCQHILFTCEADPLLSSISIKSRAFSLRSRRSSACTAPSPLGATPASAPNFASHPRRQLGSTPKLLAADGIVYPWWLTNSTADILNPRVNFLPAIARSLE